MKRASAYMKQACFAELLLIWCGGLENCARKTIKELRKERKLTQETFAEAIGMTVSAVSKMEIGNRVPSVDTFVLLSEFFGVTLDYMVLGKAH